MYFITKLRLYCACNDLAAKDKTAALGMLSVLNKFEVQSINIFQKLFDSKVQPVLLFAAEICGLDDAYCNQIEIKPQLFALKRYSLVLVTEHQML